MNIQPITPRDPEFTFTCCMCGKAGTSKDVDSSADLDGPAFATYFCGACIKKQTFQYDAFRATVSRLMKEQYGITWDDACGDSEPLTSAMEDKQSPQEFIDWWAEKYDMDSLEEMGL